jgi:hypothetical protein
MLAKTVREAIVVKTTRASPTGEIPTFADTFQFKK